MQTQEIDVLFGIPGSSQSTLPQIPLAAVTSPGVSAADLTNATPQQQAAIENQALQQQQIQSLFGVPAPSASAYDLIG